VKSDRRYSKLCGGNGRFGIWLTPVLGFIAFSPIPKGRNAPTCYSTQPFGLGPESALGSLPSSALSSAQAQSIVVVVLDSSNALPRRCSFHSSLLSCRFELRISACKNEFLLTRKFGVRRHITDRAMKPYFIVVLHVINHSIANIADRLQCRHANAVAIDGAMITLDLAVALWIVGRCIHMRHASDSNEIFKVV
jgi:hypothetical protein